MNLQEYQQAASRTLNGIPDKLAMRGNIGFGLGGEAGEILEMLKKHLYHGHPLDLVKLADELGDLLWYIAAHATEYGLELDEIAAANIDKLWQRYPDGFSQESSRNRVI